MLHTGGEPTFELATQGNVRASDESDDSSLGHAGGSHSDEK